ncbi:MAG: class I SAM-dependent methyltransferase [Candidatus Pacebacteria bacterium]|nr:class I SAM-dependent methyltransferase [Candidatus Paceibacterota bacterium]
MSGTTPYSKVAALWHPFLVLGGFDRGLRHLVRRLPYLPHNDAPLKILEIGCGSAVMSFALLKRFPNAEVLATDMDPIMVREAAKLRDKRGIPKTRCAFACSDANYPHMVQYGCTGAYQELPQGAFDVIVAGAVLEHVELDRAVISAFSLLKPGGTFLIIAMREEAWLSKLYDRVYKCVPRTVEVHRKSLLAAGFQSVLVERTRFTDFSANLTRVAIIARKAPSVASSEDLAYTVPITE